MSITTDKLDELYKKLKPHGVTMTTLLAKAVATALAQHPTLYAGTPCAYGSSSTCRTHMQHMHAGRTCSTSMHHVHAAHAWSTSMPHMHAVCAIRICGTICTTHILLMMMIMTCTLPLLFSGGPTAALTHPSLAHPSLPHCSTLSCPQPPPYSVHLLPPALPPLPSPLTACTCSSLPSPPSPLRHDLQLPYPAPLQPALPMVAA